MKMVKRLSRARRQGKQVPAQLRQCFTHAGRLKKRFATRNEALESISPGSGGKARPRRAYLCRLCSYWHLTKKGKR